MKRIKSIIIVLILSLFILSPTQAISKQSQLNKLDKKLIESINKSKKDTYSVIVILKNKPKVTGRNKMAALKSLKSKMQNSQKNIVNYLKIRKQQGSVKKYYPYWILNGIHIVANANEIKKIASRDDVKIIVHDAKLERPKPLRPKRVAAPLNGVEWNISKIGADAVWANGFDGTGIKVGILDTGIDGKHPDFKLNGTTAGKILKVSKYNNKGEIVEISPDKATDLYGHGTHVSGIVAGGNAGGTSIGVAPGAKLIVHEMDFWLSLIYRSMEWIVDPDGNPTTNDGADIVNMSWGFYSKGLPQFFEPIDNMITAGVVPIAAIGNDGEKSSGSPGNIPNTLAVGATDLEDKVTWWSSGDIVEYLDPPYEGKWIKPDISAPGDSIRSAISGFIKEWEGGEQWAELSGTSMASPHAVGVAALIKQANPSLTPKQVMLILQASSIDKGAIGKDIRYGFGRIDAIRAIEFAKKAGGLKGNISSSAGKLVAATIKVKGTDTVLNSNENGDYEAVLPEGTYELEVKSHSYLPKTENVAIVKDAEATKNITLDVSPRYLISGTVVDKLTGKRLIANLSIKSPEKVNIYSNANGEYTFSVPYGDYLLKVKSFGYETQNIALNVTDNTALDFEMKALPSILLVDDVSFEEEDLYSSVDYYKTSLDALGKEYTHWITYSDVEDYSDNVITFEDLLQYKTVIWYTDYIPSVWSSEDGKDEKARLRKNPLERYLDAGGQLILASQDLAYYTSREDEFIPMYDDEDNLPPYINPYVHIVNFFKKYLGAKFVADISKNLSAKGIPSTFMDGINFALYGSGGANNQFSPDVIKSTSKYTKNIFEYTKDARGVAGVSTDNGKWKIVYLSFGFEGINSQAKRDDVMDKSLTWLDADTFPPTLSLRFSNKVPYLRKISIIYANATDNNKVAKVEFYIDGIKKKTDTIKPYYYSFDTKKYKNGLHNLKVKVFDQTGNTKTTVRKIYIDNINPNTKLLVNSSNPSNISSITGKASLSAKTSDNMGIRKVDFYVDSKLIRRDSASPFNASINSPNFLNGTRVVKAVAKDKAGNTAISTASVVFQNPISLSIYASPSVFSPDGDGKADTTIIFYKLSQNAKITVYIRSAWGRVVTFVNDADKGKGSYAVRWDGKNKRGQIVKNGRYRAEITTTFEDKTYTSSRVVEVKK